MSSGLNYSIVWLQESNNGKSEWFYILQNWDCPVQCWDWREFATAYGPFSSEDEALEHLFDNYSNPDGYDSDVEPRSSECLEDPIKTLIEEARSRHEVVTPRRPVQYLHPWR